MYDTNGATTATTTPFHNLGESDAICAFVHEDFGAIGADRSSVSDAWSHLPTCDTGDHCCQPGGGEGSGLLLHLPWMGPVLCLILLFIKSDATLATVQGYLTSAISLKERSEGVLKGSWRLGRATRYSRIRVDTSGGGASV